ncbi:MAG: hypothetical protein IPJ41_14730 [Phycisphaerales bacterium]|nr:hypothetical protein [Phycisphaerales bacterium]
MAATAVIVSPAVWCIVRVERARQRAYVKRLRSMFSARQWHVVSQPTWSELERTFGGDTINAWQRRSRARPAYLADGQLGGHHACLIGTGSQWGVLESGPEALRHYLTASQGPATMCLFLDQPLPTFLLTRRLDGRKPVEPLTPGIPSTSGSRIGLMLPLLALAFGAVAVFALTGASTRSFGTAFSRIIASVAGALAIGCTLSAFGARRAPPKMDSPVEGLAPSFTDLFTLTPSTPPGENWLPSEDAQKWLVERRNMVFRIHAEGQRVVIALAPLPGSRPGYPMPLNEATLNDLLAFSTELSQVLLEEFGAI